MSFFSSGSEETSTTQSMPAWQEAAVRGNLNNAMNSQDVLYTDRNLTATNNPAMYAGLAGTNSLAKGMGGLDYAGYAGAGMDALMRPDLMRAQFDQNAANAVMSNTNLQPGMDALRSQFGTALADGLRGAGYGAGGFTGNFGSAGALAKGSAIGSATNGLLAGTADLYGRAQDQAIGAGLGYGQHYSDMQFGAARGLVDGGYAGAGLSANLNDQRFRQGTLLTGLNQAGIDREVNRDMFNAMAPRDTLAFRQGFAGKMGDYGGTTTTTTPTASPFQQALGAGVGLAGAYLTGGGSLLAGGGMSQGWPGAGGGNTVGGNPNGLNTPNAWWNP